MGAAGDVPSGSVTKAKETAPAFMRQRRPGSGLYRRYRAFRLMRNVRAVVSAACLAYPA